MEISISGSIVLYKTDKRVRQSIESFLNTSLPIKLFLIDNSPTDSIKNKILDLLNDKRIEYIHNSKNIGFGAAHNLAIKKMINVSKYHLVLNPDVQFEENVLPTILRYMETNLDVGLLMPKVLYPDGKIQYICKLLPAPFDLIFRRFLPSSILGKRLNKYELKFTEYNQQMEVPYLSGCFMFMRTSLLPKAGFFDEQFFLYLEDTDLSRRFYLVAKNIFFPDVYIIHHHERGSYKNLRLLYIHSRSAIKYFNKWGWWNDRQREEINFEVLQSLRNKKLKKNQLKVKTA
jgi:GT2 family glycosyltransferase